MSAQGATLEDRGTQVPMWPIVAVLILAAVTAIGLNFVNDARPTTQTTTTVGRTSTAKGVDRSEVAAVAPGISAAAIQASSAAVRERPAAPFHAMGRAHEVVLGGQASAITYANGLENPGGYVTASLSRATSGHGYGDCIHCQQRR